jgi:hypothetical protein
LLRAPGSSYGGVSRTRPGPVLMTDLPFPFWLVTRGAGGQSAPVTASPGRVALFGGADKAAAFMAGRGEAGFEFRLVSRVTFHRLVDDLRASGMRFGVLDPTPDGNGPAFDLLALYVKLTRAEDG